MAIFLPGASTIDVELQTEALGQHVARALNVTRSSPSLLLDEVTQMQKVILPNRIALDILIAAQGGTSALLHVDCCVYIPDHQQHIEAALQEVDDEMSQIQALSQDPLSTWWSQPGPTCQWFLTIVAAGACGLLV